MLVALVEISRGEEDRRQREETGSSDRRTVEHKVKIGTKRNVRWGEREESVKKKNKKKRIRERVEKKREKENGRSKFFSRAPHAISQRAHRVKMVCMGAVGLPRTFWLLQIPARKTRRTASTKTSAVIYFYPGSMPSLRTQTLSPGFVRVNNNGVPSQTVLLILPNPFSPRGVLARHFSPMRKSSRADNADVSNCSVNSCNYRRTSSHRFKSHLRYFIISRE